MKLKIYTLTTFCLFFIVKINAQDVDTFTTIGNQIDLKLFVEDTSLGQKFSLDAEDIHNVLALHYIDYNIRLNYKSEQDTTSYFRLRCRFDKIAYIDPVNPATPFFLGATAPVIIPPVKKKKVRAVQDPAETYPYIAKIIYRMNSEAYKVTIELLKYDSQQDYIDGNDQYVVRATKVIYLNVQNHSSESDVSMTTYPNPTTNHVTIEFTNATTNNVPLQSTPIQLTIFNKDGIKVHTHTVVSSKAKNNSVCYNFDTSHLAKGMYFFEIKDGKSVHIKTVIKE